MAQHFSYVKNIKLSSKLINMDSLFSLRLCIMQTAVTEDSRRHSRAQGRSAGLA